MRFAILTVASTLMTSMLISQYSTAKPATRKFPSRPAQVCSEHAAWIDGRDGKSVARGSLFRDLATRSVVLLGESHENAAHHRWQLHTLAALYSRSEKLVIAFEMFPRRVQSVLNQWVRGELSEKVFLKAVNWRGTWGYDSGLYMPLFNFARMHRIPMVALNVDRQLVSRVGAEGWAAVPTEAREGLGDPAPASGAYERALAETYSAKLALKRRQQFRGMASMPEKSITLHRQTIANIMARSDFKRFVAAQLTWDRAMAEGLAAATREHSGAVVVGVMGTGHLSNFHGVPHQLDDLGVKESVVLIPVEAEDACDHVGKNYADILFTLRSRTAVQAKRKKLRLGVFLRDAHKAAIVDRVVPASVAETTNLRKGDRIIRAAGVDIRGSSTLVDVISRQAPGTWLPLTVERSGSKVDLVAKFPPLPEEGS